MTTDENQPLQTRMGDTPNEIRALFIACEQRQRAAKSASFETLREGLIQEIAFPRLRSTPTSDADAIAQEALSSCGYLYLSLVGLLKEAPDDLKRWYWLAVWLKSEGIAELDGFLPRNVYRELTKDARLRSRGFLGAPYYSSYLVRTWLPYTEPLVRKANWIQQTKLPRNAKRDLKDLGYGTKVLKIVEDPSRKWRSAVEFTCTWLATRGGVADTETLRNAYSEVFGQRKLRKLKCSFCENPAENEFWAYGEAVPHCGEHGADRMPTSKDSTWTDRIGRQWRRQDLEICYTTTPV